MPLTDAVKLKARNRETWPLFNQVAADLVPESDSKVKVGALSAALHSVHPTPGGHAAKLWQWSFVAF